MAEAEASVVVVAKHSPLAFLLYLTKFVIEVEGIEHEGEWGERTIAVEPGRRAVRMWFRYLGRKCGVADVEVDVTPDGAATISYRAPFFVTSAGKVSLQP
jgi:hypothetical protein